MVDASFVGKALPPSAPYRVSREKVREFALAIGEGASVCLDVAAARAAGHPDVVAPPTFCVTFTMPLIEAFLRDPAFGWDYARMVHGDQSITLHRPVFAGDELVIDAEVVNVDRELGRVEVRTRVMRGGDGVGCEGRTLVSADV